VQLLAVHQNGEAIKFIKYPCIAVKLVAVDQNGTSIRFIEKPSKEVQLTAVQRSGGGHEALQFIKDPDNLIQTIYLIQDQYNLLYSYSNKEAVMLMRQKFSNTIKFIKKPGLKIQFDAVTRDINSIKYITNPHISVLNYVKKKLLAIIKSV